MSKATEAMTHAQWPLTPVERFWTHVQKTDSCWLWTRTKDTGGYGVFCLSKPYRKVPAHRFAYGLLVGPIPAGLDLDHLCRVRNCVNPAHLEPVTRHENLRRGVGVRTMVNAARTHCIRGHLLSGDNLYVNLKGERHCRECARMHDRQRSPRKRRVV